MKPIAVYLVGSREAEGEGFRSACDTPVLNLCRQLIDAGYDAARPVHVRRGGDLVLTIPSLGFGALSNRDRIEGMPQ